MILFAKTPEIITINSDNIVFERKNWDASCCMNNLHMKEDGNYYRFLGSNRSISKKDKVKELERSKVTDIVPRKETVSLTETYSTKAKKRDANIASIKSKIIIISPPHRIKYNVLNNAFHCKNSPTINDNVMVFKNAKVIDDFPIPNDYITKGTVFSRIIIDKDRRLLKAWYKNYNKISPDVILTQISE